MGQMAYAPARHLASHGGRHSLPVWSAPGKGTVETKRPPARRASRTGTCGHECCKRHIMLAGRVGLPPANYRRKFSLNFLRPLHFLSPRLAANVCVPGIQRGRT